MEWPTVEAAVARLWESPKRQVRLVLTGGEPLLDFAFVKRIVGHVRTTTPSGRSVAIDILTNGTRLGEPVVRYLAEHRVGLQVSFDGVEAAQRLRGASTFETLDSSIRSMRRRHPAWFRRVSAAVTVVPGTVPHLAASVDYLMAQRFSNILIAPAVRVAPADPGRLLSELTSQFAGIFRSSVLRYQETREVPVSDFREARAAVAPRTAPLCGASTARMAVVDVDGEVYGCPPVARSGALDPPGFLRSTCERMRIGNISDPRIAERLPAYRSALLETGLFGRRDRFHSPYGPCRDCRHVRRCDVCPLAIALAPGGSDPLSVPAFACAFSQVVGRFRARFTRQAAHSRSRSAHATN
jgi:sulfatase maturation enzyme AslB (radical SAM superfamily)